MSPYKNVIIYYFSGTGNSKNVAQWMSKEAEAKGMGCQLIDIAKIDRRKVEPPQAGSLVAFISPIHGFNYPPIMLHFIMRFPRGKNNVLLMNTRAGMLIGKWVTPGLTGIAFYLSAFMLVCKGSSIKAMFPVDLPSNWISLHPSLSKRAINYLHIKNKERVIAFAQKVYSGKSDFRALREMIQDILVAPISLGYYFIGRFFIAKTFYASSDCDGCDLCIKSCPTKAIIKIDNRPFWTFNCESCMKCIDNCPKQAIETGHGYVIGYLLFSSTLTGLFFHYFGQLFIPIENAFIHFVIESLLFLFLFALFYLLIHFLMCFKPFERLMVYTSFTKYKFWGRYKALKNF
jgi:ferredoxin